MTDPAPYIHGTSREEQERLALMNDILNARCLTAVAPHPGERVLDVGAGTGLFARDLAGAVTAGGAGGSVLAVERDPTQLAAAERTAAGVPALELRHGDVYDPPLESDEWGSFDLVHARFLLEHLRRPDDAVEVMVRATRPGGRIALIDDDHSLMRFWPDPGGMVELWEAYVEQYERLGYDAFVGRKLAALLHEAGASVERTDAVHYGGCSGQPGFRGVVENLAAVVDGARAEVVDHTDWADDDVDAALDAYRAWSERPDATIWYALPVAVGVVPE